MLKKCLLLLGLFISVSVATESQSPVLPRHPNIIIFLVDDMGWQDCSVPFWDKQTPLNKLYRTPNMEKLAAEGMKFTNAYANSVCTPTRVSLITGLNAAHHRVTNWTSPYKDSPTDHKDDMLEPPQWNHNGFSPEKNIPFTVYATPLPRILREAGYFTIHTGKAHWGSAGTPGASPYNMGFTVNIAGNSIGHPQSYYGENNYGNMPGKTTINAVPDLTAYYGTNTFLTEALTKEALQALETPVKSRQPFFLYMAHYAVHIPVQADNRFVQHYLSEGLDSTEAAYASLIEGMDKSLGDIMQFLKEKGIEKNTVILFMSDNGGLSLVPPRGGKQHTHNLPLRAGKGSLYEGGIREPMIVKWPGVTVPGSASGQYLQVQDFFPTVLEMAGIKDYAAVQDIDGRSFVPVMKDKNFNDDQRALIWHYPNRWINNDREALCYSSAIRQGDWKLIYLMKQGKLELYNLRDDIGEQKDLAAAMPEKVKQLAALLTGQLKAWKAQMPVNRMNNKPVPWPDEIAGRK